MTVTHAEPSQRKTIDIGDGLIMRWSTKADTDNVVDLVSRSFRWLPLGDPLPEDSIPDPNEFVKAAARRLLSGKNAVMSEYDCALVEDTKRGKGKNPIVACVSLHRCQVYYGSVKFFVGKPEMIATDTSYRNQGFVRRLLYEVVHPESETRGDAFQFISGIQHFYRQFGYEYGIGCDSVGTIESPDFVPALGKDKSEPFILRTATQDDLPLLNRLSSPERLHHNSVMGLLYTPEYWQWTVHDIFQDKQSRFDCILRDTRIIVEAGSGKAIGFTVVSYAFVSPQLEAVALEDDADYVHVIYPALRQLFAQSKEIIELAAKEREVAKNKNQLADKAATNNTTAPVEAKSVPFKFYVALHERHPFCQLLGKNLTLRPNIPGYKLYTRIHSYPAFVKTVTPELEKRLSNSALAGVTGRLRLDFFRQVEGSSGRGLEVFFERGKVVDATEWVNPSPEGQLEEKLAWKKAGITPTIYYATFAPLTFTLLMTGRRSLEELQWAYGENYVKDDETRLLLNTLFPNGHHRFDQHYW
ncbi:hypothetical protein BGZ65_007903 [Modicella reniformis]|uniref:Uncharacterized protein n=1 Tax=Modicella reniformis TaxID=1440133 RepID=A0A9P6IN14_9FUNG|nr:hypothetical protein BGZ65_007903 [Modicella reniformis]